MASQRGRLKPPAGARIDRSHPLARDLAWLVLPGAGHRHDLVSGGVGQAASANTNWSAATLLGSAVSHPSTTGESTVSWPWPVPLNSLTDKISIVVWLRITDWINYSGILHIPYQSGGWTNPYCSVGMRRSGLTTSVALLWATTSSAFEHVVSDTGILANDGVLRQLVITRDGTAVKFYVNGIKYGADKTATAGNFLNPNKRRVALLARGDHIVGDGGETINGATPYAAIWTRALPEPEIAKLYADPYQIILPGQLTHRILISGSPSSVDATIEAATATATSGAAVPTVSWSGAVATETATATGAAPVPAVSYSGSVAAEASAATGAAIAPTPSVAVLATPATATADTPAPTVTWSGSVAAETATATGDAIAPTVSAGVVIPAELASATGSALAPSLVIHSTITAVTAAATADADAPTLFVGALVAAETASATADAIAPTIAYSGSVVAETATATSAALSPVAAMSVLAETSTVTADATEPTPGVTILAESAAATSASIAPTLDAPITIVAPVATAAAASAVPAIAISSTIAAERATATGAASAPTIAFDFGLDAEIAAATSAAVAPTVSVSTGLVPYTVSWSASAESSITWADDDIAIVWIADEQPAITWSV